MRGYIEKYEVEQPTYAEAFTALGNVARFATSNPLVRLVVVLDPSYSDADDRHFLESISAGCRNIGLDVHGSPIIRPGTNPSPAFLTADAPTTAGDSW